MIQAIIKPAKRRLSGRRQWRFEIRAANDRLLDPRDTYNNRDDAIRAIDLLFSSGSPAELVVYRTDGEVEYRQPLR